jgi:hypothetical protein
MGENRGAIAAGSTVREIEVRDSSGLLESDPSLASGRRGAIDDRDVLQCVARAINVEEMTIGASGTAPRAAIRDRATESLIVEAPAISSCLTLVKG